MVKVKDLADQILDKSRADELLYSPVTGEEYSANAGDYWDVDPDHVFKDVEGNKMILVTKSSSYNEV